MGLPQASVVVPFCQLRVAYSSEMTIICIEFNYLSVSRHLVCFCTLPAVHNAAMNSNLQTFLRIYLHFLETVPSGITRSCTESFFPQEFIV